MKQTCEENAWMDRSGFDASILVFHVGGFVIRQKTNKGYYYHYYLSDSVNYSLLSIVKIVEMYNIYTL